MDPKACLEMLDALLRSGDPEEAAEHLANYREWRRKQGFEPGNILNTGMSGDKFAKLCRHKLESLTQGTSEGNATARDIARLHACELLTQAGATLLLVLTAPGSPVSVKVERLASEIDVAWKHVRDMEVGLTP